MPSASEDNKENSTNENPEAQPPEEVNQSEPLQKTPKKRKYIKIIIGLLAVAILAAAAFMVLSKSDEKSDTGQTQKKDIPLLRIGYTSGPLNAFYPGGYSNTSNFLEVNLQAFEGLVRYEDKTKIAPALATGWSNPDSSTWVFNIRPNVKFHTGRTMTAEDVKASLDAAKENEELDLYYSTIESVEVTDNDKVTIKTDGTDPILLNKLNYLFIFDTKSDKKDDPVNGTGPYVVKEGAEPEEAKVALTAYDEYYQGRPSTRELEMSWYEEEGAAVDAFKSGKADIIGSLSPENVKKLDNFEPYLTNPPGTRYISISTNRKNSPVAKKEFRQGLEYLLDKEALVKEDKDGLPANQFIPQDVPGYDPSIKGVSRNVEKAKELFIAAGYPNGATLSVITSSTPVNIEDLQNQLAEGGIKLQIKDIPNFDDFLTQALAGTTDLSIQAYISDFLDGTDFLGILTAADTYKNDEIDGLVEEASESLDSAERLSKLKQASKLASDDVAVLPLHYVQDTYAMNKPYVLKQDTTSTLVEAYFWKAYQN